MASGEASHSDQTRPQQQHAGRFRNGRRRLLSRSDLPGYRHRPRPEDRHVVHAEEERTGPARRLLARYPARRVGLAISVGEREQDRRVVEVNEDAALLSPRHRPGQRGREGRLVRPVDSLRGRERHLEGEGLAIVVKERWRHRHRPKVIDVRAGVGVGTNAEKAAGGRA